MSPELHHKDRMLLLTALSDTPPFATVRGRQTIVRNALGGYPLSDEIDKALRWLDWETAAKIPWGLLVLFGGGIAIAGAFKTSGLSGARETG